MAPLPDFPSQCEETQRRRAISAEAPPRTIPKGLRSLGTSLALKAILKGYEAMTNEELESKIHNASIDLHALRLKANPSPAERLAMERMQHEILSTIPPEHWGRLRDPQGRCLIMSETYQFTKVCPWIAPCPVCGAQCQVTVKSSVTGLAIDVDYTCQRKHEPHGQ